MKLESIFGSGHKVACSKDPDQYVVLIEASDDEPAGYYFIDLPVLEEAVVKRVFDRSRLGRRMGIKDLMDQVAKAWFPAVDLCWCDPCAETRQFRRTLSE